MTFFNAVPLRAVEWNAKVPDDKIYGTGYWPPEPARYAIERSERRWEMEHGEWHTLTQQPDFRVTVNLFASVLDRVSDLLTSSPITHADNELEMQMNDAVYEASRALIRDNAAIIWLDPRDGELSVLDARYWFPTGNGWVYATPIYGKLDYAITDLHNEDAFFIHVLHQDGETLTDEVRYFNSANVGGEAPVDKLVSDPVEQAQAVVPNTLTVVGKRGQSCFDVIAPLVFEISRRHTANSYALGNISSPPFIPIVDPNEASSIVEDDNTSGNIDLSGNTSPLANRLHNAAKAAKVDIIDLDRRVQGLEPVTYDPQIDSSLQVIADLRIELMHALGMPNLLSSEGMFGNAPSGTALKRINTALYARTLRLQTLIRRGLEMTLQKAGINDSFEWADVFEALDEADDSIADDTEEEIPDERA